MNGGYTMVDCGGINLLSESPQTVNGLHDKVAKAYATKKPVIAYNILWGADLMSPIGVMVNHLPGTPTTFVCTASTLQIRVDKDDGVTIVNMLD